MALLFEFWVHQFDTRIPAKMNETPRVVISAQASLFCSRAVQTCSHIFMLSAAQHTSQPPISSARNGRVISSRCSLPRSLFEGHAGPTALRVRQTCQEGRKRGNTPSRCPAPFLCGIIQRLIQLDRQRCFRAASELGSSSEVPRPFWRGSIQRCARGPAPAGLDGP